jgi:NAD-dependent dihydropyrimidine dehydrogenase PreA subunit
MANIESGGNSLIPEVKVDLEKFTECCTCVTTRPVDVFEMKKIDDSEKSEPVNEDQCIACRAYEVQCPESAIIIIQ